MDPKSTIGRSGLVYKATTSFGSKTENEYGAVYSVYGNQDETVHGNFMLPNSCTQVLMSLVDKENVRNSILGSIPVHELTDSISRCNSIYKNLSYMGLDHSEVSSIASYNLSFLITPIEN